MRRLVLAMVLLLLAPLAQAGTPEDPEIVDPDDVDEDSPFSSYDSLDVLAVWLETETNESFVFAIQMAGPVEQDQPQGLSQELRYSLRATYENSTISVAASINDDGLSGGEAEGDILRLTIARNAWANMRPGVLLEDLHVTTSGWTGGDSVSSGADEAPDTPGGGRDYLVGSQAEPGMDHDGDGIDDRDEVGGPTDPARPDTDLDGLNDGDELAAGTDPNDPDTDGDGLLDGDEVDLGTNPLLADSDGDGINDKQELDDGSDPLLADSDSDGLDDGEEAAAGTDPTKADSDGDGINDQTELDNALDPTDGSDGLMDHDGDGVTTADELAAGTDPYVSDLEEEGLTAEGPAGLPWWLWIVIVLFILIIIFLILWFTVLAKRRTDDDFEDDDIPEDEHEVIEMEEGMEGRKYKPLVIDENYLTEGLEPEDIQRARRLFEERERRYLDQAYPGRTREFDADLDVEDDKKAIKQMEREKALRERQAAKQAKREAKQAAKLAKLEAKAARKGN